MAASSAARMSTTSMDVQTTETSETVTKTTDEEHMAWLQSRSMSEKLEINEKIFAKETEQYF